MKEFKLKNTNSGEVEKHPYTTAVKILIINARIKGSLVLESNGYIFQNGDIVKDASKRKSNNIEADRAEE